MILELEQARIYSENKQFDKALEILLLLEQTEENEIERYCIEILKEIFSAYKNSGDLKSALEYYKKFTDEEYKKIISENKEKTDKLNSTLKIHSAQKETELLKEKNNQLHTANKELNDLREKKNELLTIVSEELKIPIVTIEGIALNHFRAMKQENQLPVDEIKKDLEMIETLSQDILKNVNSILEKNKEEYKE